jgi:GDP-mannose 6-dehydrogenase
VRGVDVDASKVALIQAGRSPVVESGIDELIRPEVAGGSLRATTDARRGHGAG